nr:glycoside hydrolase family 3 N-terminal domain-containing protein [Zhihengliuella flava]
MPGFQGTTAPAWVLSALDEGLASVCIYGPNIASPAQVTELMGALRAAAPQALFTLDEEGGDVTRLHYLTGSNQPGNAVLGRLNDPATTASSAAAIAAELRELGFNLNLAPDADVNSTDTNPVIGVRSFGADAELVARHTVSWVAGLQDAGVAACAKHFPGHGDTSTDSHHTLPTIDVDRQTLTTRELVPFAAAIDGGIASIMTSHIMVPSVDSEHPATFSRAILHDLLRAEMGFEGAIITDALDMAGASAETGIEVAAVRALAAGADLLCLGSETTQERYAGIVEAIVRSVRDGHLSLERLQDAARRTAELAAAYSPSANWPEATEAPGPAIAAAFDVSASARRWIELPQAAEFVTFDSATNLAVGHVPWGPAAVQAHTDIGNISADSKLALIGRGIDEHHGIWKAAADLRRSGREVIVVDCGWPRMKVDLVTFGASRAVAAALVDFLTR